MPLCYSVYTHLRSLYILYTYITAEYLHKKLFQFSLNDNQKLPEWRVIKNVNNYILQEDAID